MSTWNKKELDDFRLFLCALALGLGVSLLQIGCAHQREDTVLAMAKEVVLKVVDKAELRKTDMRASGKVVNPRYAAQGFFGVGPYFRVEVGVTGVEVEADVQASGEGEGEVDLDLREKLYRILANREISAEQRRQMLFDTITGVRADAKEIGLAIIDAFNRLFEERQPTTGPTSMDDWRPTFREMWESALGNEKLRPLVLEEARRLVYEQDRIAKGE